MRKIFTHQFFLGVLIGSVLAVFICSLILLDETTQENIGNHKIPNVIVMSSNEKGGAKIEDANVRPRNNAKVIDQDVDTSFTSSSKVLDDPMQILVRKDVLLRSMTFDLDLVEDTASIMDTLKTHLDITETEHHKTYILELWQSPLGYKGYKMAGNKIQIFGMDTVKIFDLKKIEERLMLIADNSIFELKNESDFSMLKTVGK